jgi:cytochrome c biogenesis protein
LQVGDRLYVGGKTNRAQVSFESELIDVTNVADQGASVSFA